MTDKNDTRLEKTLAYFVPSTAGERRLSDVQEEFGDIFSAASLPRHAIIYYLGSFDTCVRSGSCATELVSSAAKICETLEGLDANDPLRSEVDTTLSDSLFDR